MVQQLQWWCWPVCPCMPERVIGCATSDGHCTPQVFLQRALLLFWCGGVCCICNNGQGCLTCCFVVQGSNGNMLHSQCNQTGLMGMCTKCMIQHSMPGWKPCTSCMLMWCECGQHALQFRGWLPTCCFWHVVQPPLILALHAKACLAFGARLMHHIRHGIVCVHRVDQCVSIYHCDSLLQAVGH